MRPSKPRKEVKVLKEFSMRLRQKVSFGRQRFVVFLLVLFSGRILRHWIVRLDHFERPLRRSQDGVHCRLIASSPGSPNCVGRLRRLTGGARDTDRALRRSVHVLGHVCLARRRLSRCRRSCRGCRRQRMLGTSWTL